MILPISEKSQSWLLRPGGKHLSPVAVHRICVSYQ
jgi:hypothetical protein